MTDSTIPDGTEFVVVAKAYYTSDGERNYLKDNGDDVRKGDVLELHGEGSIDEDGDLSNLYSQRTGDYIGHVSTAVLVRMDAVGKLAPVPAPVEVKAPAEPAKVSDGAALLGLMLLLGAANKAR